MINCEKGDPAGIISNHDTIDLTMRLAAYIPQEK